jgi:hypothetical protein
MYATDATTALTVFESPRSGDPPIDVAPVFAGGLLPDVVFTILTGDDDVAATADEYFPVDSSDALEGVTEPDAPPPPAPALLIVAAC